MGENTKIEWATHTFNPWIGCAKVSTGCANCYAEHLMDKRLGRVVWGSGNARQRTSLAYWQSARRWNLDAADGSRPRVFCASLADWLDDEVPRQWRFDLLELIDATPNLDWLLLTKRPENLDRLTKDHWVGGVPWPVRPPKNVWLGVSAENQEQWDRRVRILQNWTAAVRFVSMEPLLGPVDIGNHPPDWLIVGGESGAVARPMNPNWVRTIRDQAHEHRVRFFFKQWGGTNKVAAGRELDGQTWSQVPQTEVSKQG